MIVDQELFEVEPSKEALENQEEKKSYSETQQSTFHIK